MRYTKYINSYKSFNYLDKILSIDINSVLSSINAEEVDIFANLNKYVDLEFLNKDSNFINKISLENLKNSDVQNSDDYETFVYTSFKFMFLYEKNVSELGNPIYILIQINGKPIHFYKINGDIKKFYDQLSSKTIEIEDNGEKFIYQTSDSTSWDLKSVKETDVYKRNFGKEDLENIIKNRNAKVKII